MFKIQTEEGISEVELLKLEAMAGRASKGPFFKDGFDVQDDGDNEVACCNRSDEIDEDTQEANAHYIAAACNAVPALVAEVRRLREALNKEHRAWQCADARGDWLEMENAALREKVEAWGKEKTHLEETARVLAEQVGKGNLAKIQNALEWADEEAKKREAVHADRE